MSNENYHIVSISAEEQAENDKDANMYAGSEEEDSELDTNSDAGSEEDDSEEEEDKPQVGCCVKCQSINNIHGFPLNVCWC